MKQSHQDFIFQWHSDRLDYATQVKIDIKPAENGTIVCLHEHGYSDTETAFKAMLICFSGWGEVLTLLKFYLEYGLRY